VAEGRPFFNLPKEMDLDKDYPPVSPFRAGLFGRCPHCGRGKIFAHFIDLRDKCDCCGLDFAFADAGDGPAVFVCLIGGFLVLGAALWTELTYEPPYWVHLVIFMPLTVIVCGGLLRLLKGLLVALQFRNKAEQGRLER
jgi:uncharacterized protein (DUF983 family)